MQKVGEFLTIDGLTADDSHFLGIPYAHVFLPNIGRFVQLFSYDYGSKKFILRIAR